MKLLVSLLLLAAFPSAIFAAEQRTTNDRLSTIFAGAHPIAAKNSRTHKKMAVNQLISQARKELPQTVDMHCPQCVRNIKSNILLMHPKLKKRLPDESYTYAECLKRLPYASEETFSNARGDLINLSTKFHISPTRMEKICALYRYIPTEECLKHTKALKNKKQDDKKEENKTNGETHENHA